MNSSIDRAAEARSAARPRTDIEAEAIRSEQAKVVYRQLPPLLMINALVACATAYGLSNIVAHPPLIVWLALMLGVSALRGGLWLAYRKAAGPRPGRRWRVWFAVGSGATGLLWGAGAAVLFPADSLDHQLFILFVLVGMSASAAFSLTAYMPAFYAYFPVSLLPFSIVLLRLGDSIPIALGMITCIYVAALIFFARTINRALVESLSLRFENVELVRQLREQRDEARHANVGKSKFLAAASHDLRQPLHALALFTSALDERISYPEVRRIVDNINASIRALERLFSSLLDISRLDAGVLQPEMRDFQLDDLLSGLVDRYMPEAHGKGLDLRYARCGLVVRSDPALLERIVSNYLSNAIRYTERGDVRLQSSAQDGGIRIDVVDTGIGVPVGQQHAIFGEFHQLGNPDRDRSKGLGLGLAIVERVSRLLDHPIEVESEPGSGSRFSVTVPVGDPAAVPTGSPPAVHDARNDLVGLCVIVVDDDIGVRAGMSTLLGQWGCRVIAAASEDEAVAALQASAARLDVILVDYRLAGARTGVDAIARLRSEFGADVPALIVTGDTVAETLRDAAAAGHALVHKPIEPAMLRAFLRSARRRRAAS